MNQDITTPDEPPKWLTDVQNNSWEPEIILSGLTITILFFMNDSIYNFFAMLVQQHNVEMTSHIGYSISILSLNMVIMVLIFHLLLRGFWVGLIGLSYVYPAGVNTNKLPKEKRHIVFEKPVSMVIKIEKICSLLFACIFTIIIMLFGSLLMYLPFIIIDIFIDNVMLSIVFLLAYLAIFSVPLILLSTVYKGSKYEIILNRNMLNNIIYTMSSNSGNKLIFALFFVILLSSIPLSLSQMAKFRFSNYPGTTTEAYGIPIIKARHYQNTREANLRVQRAVIKQIDISGQYLDLKLAFYKEDLKTLKRLEQPNTPHDVEVTPAQVVAAGLPGVYQINIDGQVVTDVKWSMTQIGELKQQGLNARIKIDSLSFDTHTLGINKVIYKKREAQYLWLKNWDSLIFNRIK